MTHQPEAGSTTAKAPKKKRRIFLWVFLAVQVLFVAWIIAGLAGASGTPAEACEGLSVAACNDAESIGTGIGVALIVGVWLAVDFLLAVVYGVYRLAKRT
jgi:purine-cytosine permease-like protein